MIYEPQSLIEHFFIFSDIPVNQERGNYLLSLVFLSIILAIMGAFTSLRVINGLFKCDDIEKTHFHILSVICLSVTIWSMHFIGMLSYDMEMVHTYNLPMTFLSMIAAAIAAFCFVYVVRFFKPSFITHILASILLGAAICVMHYYGMQAMIMDADILYQPDLWVLSILVAVLASFSAIKIIYKLKSGATLTRMVISSTAIGIAICGMHYTGMAATVFLPYADCRLQIFIWPDILSISYNYFHFMLRSIYSVTYHISNKNFQHKKHHR